MSLERTPTEVGAAVATDAVVLAAAARELRLPLEALAATRLAGDASSRAFFRLSHAEGTVIAVRYPRPFSVDDGSSVRFERWCAEQPDGRLTFANDPLCHLEMTALLTRFGVPVPAILAVADREGIIFVEDGGDDLLQSWCLSVAPSDREAAYERAVGLVAQIRSATNAVLEGGAIAGRLAFDADKLAWELEFFRLNCFERFLAAPLDSGLDADVRAEHRALAEELAARPRYLCHRDYHARNLLVRPGLGPSAGILVIDFQDARLGPLTYDIVSLLEDPYAEIEPELRARLLERFVDGACAADAFPGAEAFHEEYALMSLQRLLKAIGTYTNQAAVRGKDEYLPYIRPAAAAARAAIERLGRFPALGRAIDIIEATDERI